MPQTAKKVACSRDGCNKVVTRSGLCAKHYSIALRTAEAFPVQGQGRQLTIVKYPHKRDIILNCIKEGLSDSAACAKAGVSLRSFQKWMETAEVGEDEDLVLFAYDVEMARTEWEGKCVKAVEEAITHGRERTKTVVEKDANGAVTKSITTVEHSGIDVETAKWWLERRRSDEYGKSFAGDDPRFGAPINIQINVVPHEAKNLDDVMKEAKKTNGRTATVSA